MIKAGAINLPVFYLRPGEMYICEKPSVVSTVLGSCVSVTMFNQRLKIGAICHCLLPDDLRRSTGPDQVCYRFVSPCIKNMLERLKARGIGPHELEAKLFGGADMNSSSGKSTKLITVGIQNVQSAVESLRLAGLRTNVTHVGGTAGRKLLFYSHTGEVFLKRINNSLQTSYINGGKTIY